MSLHVERLSPTRRGDFHRLHENAPDAGWCRCVAWWVPSWEGWSERSGEANLTLREGLFARGEDDGYLLYDGDEPVAWCQAGPRDRLHKLVRQLGLAREPGTWGLSCFLVVSHRRGEGLAAALLDGVLADLRHRGVPRVEAYPKRGPELDQCDLWNGPEDMFLKAGFAIVRDDLVRPVLARDLG